MSVNEVSPSELEVLKQRITELEAKNAKLEVENAELRKENTEIPDLRNKLSVFDAEIAELKRRNAETLRVNDEYNKRRDAENAKLKARIEELEFEFRDRITKVEQKQTLNDNSSNNNLSNFNSVADQESTVMHHEKPLVDTSLPEDKETDAFLDEVHKKKVSNEIRQRNREKKQRDQEALVISQDVTKILEVTDMSTSEQDEQDLSQSYEASSESIRSASCVLSKQPQVNASKLACNLENREDSSRSESCDIEELKSDQHDEVIAKLDKNIIVEQELKQQLSSPAHTSTSDQTSEEQDPSSDTAQNIVCMFKKANKLGQEAILYWCYFIEKYDKRIDNLVAGGVKKKTATSMVYQEIKQLLPEITGVNLRQKILRARKLFKLFNTLGLVKISQVSYSADAISSLSYPQIQSIIDHVNSIACSTVKNLHDQSNVTSKINLTNTYIPPKAPQYKPTYDRSYFRNKTLDQYPNLYREFSSENFDYYGIADETSCPLCKLDHNDEESIEGRYKAESYFIKCEQREIEIVA
jgi:hypothetical protein